MKYLFMLLVIFFAITFAGYGQSGTIKINEHSKIYLSGNAPRPVLTAISNLQRDFANVLGDSLEMVSTQQQIKNNPAIIISWPDSKIKSKSKILGWEEHQMLVEEINGQHHLLLEGADIRGTIYAIYSFSEKFLEIPPLWFWAMHQPEKKNEIQIPRNTLMRFQSPYVKYRTFFPNDKQLLDAFEQKSPLHRERVFETMMRLKYNCYETSSLAKFPNNGDNNESLKRARIAHKHGFVITTHHIYPVGASLGDWEAYWKYKGIQTAPKLDIKNLDKLRSFYVDHINGIKEENFEMLWTLGFRGAGDTPWFTAFEGVEANDSLFGAVIEKMINVQIELLQEKIGGDVMMRSQFYNEGADLFAAGHINLPEEQDNLIWSFDDVSTARVPQLYMLDYDFPPRQKIGYYFHFQHSRTGSHFVQGVGPWKMEKNYRMVDLKSNVPLAFSVVNAGNIREFVMELNAHSAMMWDFKNFNSDEFLIDFCKQYFGEENANEIASLYREFYYSYWETKEPTIEGMERQYIFNDYRLIRAMQSLLFVLPKGYTSFPLIWEAGGTRVYYLFEEKCGPSQLEMILAGLGTSIGKLEKVVVNADDLALQIKKENRYFFNNNIRYQAYYFLELTRCVYHLAKVMEARPRSDYHDSQPVFQKHMQLALDSFEKAREFLDKTEEGPFVGWYDTYDKRYPFEELKDKLMEVQAYFNTHRF